MRETGLLLRRNNTYYEDYREIDGVKVPFTTREEDAFRIRGSTNERDQA